MSSVQHIPLVSFRWQLFIQASSTPWLLRSYSLSEFGGVCFLLNGNMLVAVWNDSLIARLGIEQAIIALKEPDVRAMDLTGRPMKGWIIVELDGIDSDRRLTHWIDLSTTFARTLPAK